MLVRLDKLKKKAERGKKLSVKEEEEKKRIEEKLKSWKAEKKARSKKEKGQLAAAKAQAKALQTVKQKSTKQKQALDRARSQRYKQMQAKVKKLESKLRKYQRQRHNIFAKMFVPATKKKLAKAKAETEGDFIRLFSKRNVPKLIKAIHAAGGIAVLAHPACYWAINLERMVKSLIKDGLDGIEVYYPYPRFRKIVKFHSSKDVKKIADKYPELIQTGGTDFHGEIFY